MKLLLTGAFAYTQAQIRQIRQMGHEVHLIQEERIPLAQQELDFAIDEIEGTVCNGLFLYNQLSDFKSLRLIQLTSAGYDRVPLNEIRSKGITLLNAAGVYSVPMAEWAVLQTLSLFRNSKFFIENQAKHNWEKKRDLLELSGKQVVLFGLGNVGRACAKRFHAFGCRVVGVDLYQPNCPDVDRFCFLEQAEQALEAADVIICALPLTEETKGFFSDRTFGQMKKGSVFLNFSRGGTVNLDALLRALQHGGLAGAALDVFETEPLSPDSPLWDCENVLVTPHNSFVGDGNSDRLFALIQHNLKIETAGGIE